MSETSPLETSSDTDTSLTLSAWQARAEAFDQARGWDQVTPEHTLLHLVEEVGEIARSFLQSVRYKDVPITASTLGEELADLLMLLLKFASSQGIVLETELTALFERLQKRFPEAEGRQALVRYLEWGRVEQERGRINRARAEQVNTEQASTKQVSTEE